MKIGISGSHSTGKSTLCSNLSARQSGILPYKVCPEVPREVIEYLDDPTFFQLANNNLLRQTLLLFSQCVAEFTYQSTDEVLITDRTLVDHIAYTIILFPEFVNSPEYKVIVRSVISYLRSYTLFIKLAVGQEVYNDGVRELDKDFHLKVDQSIDDLYRRFGCSVVEIGGPFNERADRVHEVVQGLLLNRNPV